VSAPQQWKVKRLTEKVARYYGITVEEIVRRGQEVHAAWPRHVIYYLAMKRGIASATQIGRALDSRSCSAVLNGVKRVKGRLAKEPVIRAQIEAVERELQ
jgi:chromosomal replication initiation ATPase DnaA